MKKNEQIIEQIYQYRHCRRCRVIIPDEEFNIIKEKKLLPLCKECSKFINEQLKKCLPLMQKLKL